nr:serine/threonine-protein kinase [Micromonospora sp. DSM 115978]
MTQIPTWSGGPVNPTNGRAAPGATIGGRYSLRAAVGHGGMGTVWRAADTLLRRDVAVKEVVLPPGLAPSDRDAMYERTLREARAAAALQHPAVVQVYDVVTEAGRPWIVMELLDARSLADMVIEDGPLAPRAVAKIGIALLGALEVAHAIGVLHRDVKPANVLICNDGRCVLTDFGVARMPTDVQLTTPGMVLGSPHFISPERAMGQDFGPPSDLFSLGVTLYTAVEGRPPFDKGDPIETMHAVVEDPPAPPTRCGPLTGVLMGLLEKDPARRFDVPTARGMLRELLAGPLASTAPGHLTTDPYSVVPPQRSPWQPPAAAPQPQPTGQIGGRAMLAPGESLTDRLAELRRAGHQMPTPAQYAAAGLANTNPAQPPAQANPVDAPTGALTGATGAMPGKPWDQPTRAGWGAAPGGGPGSGVRPVGAAAGGKALLDRALVGAKRTGGNAVQTVKGWPRNLQLAAAGGVAVALLLGAVLLLNGPDQEPTPPPQAAPTSAAPVGAAFETQAYAEKGLSVNVPAGWKRATGQSYVDFTDPDDSGRRVRIIVEDFGGTQALRWAEIAENGLESRSRTCAKPYNQISMTEAELAGRPGAEFEYTCGSGDNMRHGVWRMVPHSGKAYSFYLTTTDSRFEESRAIFDEMVRSFELTAAG